jgi:cytochrome c oxidase subunit 2
MHAAGDAQRIEISAKRFEFVPSVITVKKGEPVEIVLTTADVPHGLKFPDFNQQVRIAKGAPSTLRFTPDKAGDFTGACSVFCGSGHGKMKLTLHVTE